MMNRKILIVAGIVILVCLIAGCFLLWKQVPTQSPSPPTPPAKPKKELKLSDFPEAFKDGTLIIVGDNASEIELQVADEILKYLETYGKTEEELRIKCCVEYILSLFPVAVGPPHCGDFLTHSCKKVLNVSNTFDSESFKSCMRMLEERGFKVDGIPSEIIYPNGRRVCNLNIYYKPGYCECPEGSTKIKKIDEFGEEKEICIDSLKIVKYSKLREEDKRNYNLIVIGTPKTNPFLEEVYALTNATKITEEFPGEGKGVLEILPNPWDEEKIILLIQGSDEYAIKVSINPLKSKEFYSKKGYITNSTFVEYIPNFIQKIYLEYNKELSIEGLYGGFGFPKKLIIAKQKNGKLYIGSFYLDKQLATKGIGYIKVKGFLEKTERGEVFHIKEWKELNISTPPINEKEFKEKIELFEPIIKSFAPRVGASISENYDISINLTPESFYHEPTWKMSYIDSTTHNLIIKYTWSVPTITINNRGFFTELAAYFFINNKGNLQKVIVTHDLEPIPEGGKTIYGP